MDMRTLKAQFAFIAEVDKLKSVLRKTSPIGMERRENSAEHSWQVILCAVTFQEHANEPVDILKVVKMLMIHDVVEVDVGDVFHYDKGATEGLYERELAAAKRIFGLLNDELRDEYLALWKEFEARETPEARYAASVDRLIAFLMNINNQGGTWKEFNVAPEDVLDKNAHIKIGSKTLWEMANTFVKDAKERGYFNEKVTA